MKGIKKCRTDGVKTEIAHGLLLSVRAPAVLVRGAAGSPSSWQLHLIAGTASAQTAEERDLGWGELSHRPPELTETTLVKGLSAEG